MRLFGLKISITKTHRQIDWFRDGSDLIIPISWQHDIPFVYCLIENIQLKMMLDTGANINVLFESSFYKSGISLVGEETFFDSAKGKKPCQNLGEFDIHLGLGLRVLGAPFVSGVCPVNFNADGILSNAIWRDFDAIIDYQVNEIRLRSSNLKVDKIKASLNS